MIGIDRELAPNVGFSASYTYRYYNHFDWNSLIGVNASNYTQTGSCVPMTTGPCGVPASNNAGFLGSYNVPYYALNANAVPTGAGTSFEEHKGYHQVYQGFELSAVMLGL